MRNVWMSSFALIVLTFAFASQASAAGAIALGGRTAVTANFSVITTDPDDSAATTLVYVSGTLTRSTADARWEYGAGFAVAGLLLDVVDVVIFTPSVQARINSDLLGPEENILGYVGAIAGLTVIDIDADAGGGSKEVGAFGPKFGAEYYFSSNIALQLEDFILFDTDGGVNNNLTLGVKLLF